MIKIDAEGSELAVVQGAQGIIERDRPEIYVEVGPEELTGDGGPVSAFLRGVYTLKISLYSDIVDLFIYLFIRRIDRGWRAVVCTLSKVVSRVDLYSKCTGSLTFENFRQRAGTCRGSVWGDPISCLSRCTPWSRSKWSRIYLFSLSFFINCGCPGGGRAIECVGESVMETALQYLSIIGTSTTWVPGRSRVYSQQKQSTRWSLSATVRRGGKKKNILAMSV
jgi:hypothetical protein